MSVSKNGLAISHKRRIRAFGKYRKLIAVLLLGTAVVQLTGCSAWTGVRNNWNYNGNWNEMMMGYRNASSASKAWHRRKHQFCNEKYIRDFARGFKAGYTAVADGGDGCTPAFPPREYWGWKYQSCEGQARVAAWFAGFPHGARAAEEDGIGNWTQIQTSSRIQQHFVDHGRLYENYQGIYPVPQAAVPQGIHINQGVNQGFPVEGETISVMEGEMPDERPAATPVHIGPTPDPSAY